MSVDCTLRQYLHFAEHMFCSSQGLVLSHILSLNDEHVQNPNLWNINIVPLVTGKCVAPLDDLIIKHLLCVKALHMQNFVEVFNYQSACVSGVVDLLSQHGSKWLLPVMNTVCSDLRLAAQKADVASHSHGAILEKATDMLMTCYRVCIRDAGPSQENNKKAGLLCPVNHLLRLYFRTDKYNLCQAMIRAVEPAIGEISPSLAQQVTFRYFVGRLAVLEADFVAANRNLTFAFRKCHPQSFKNKQMILTYLIPVKMILGYMPPKALIEKYNLPLFWDLLIAVKEGNLKIFELIIEGNRGFFVDAGLFIALENLRMITYRNVFKRVYLSQGSNKVPVSSFQVGLQLMSQESVDASETQCLIASLIYNNKIKAYMSYQRQIVVFNAENPFPRLSSLYYQG